MKKWLPIIARVLLGLIFFASGVFAFATHFAIPAEGVPENLRTFVNGLAATGYFLPFLKGTEIACGLLLLIGAFVPLALIVLAPIILNIVLVHAFLAPQGLVLALILGALEIYLAFFASPYKEVVGQIFRCPMREAKIAKSG